MGASPPGLPLHGSFLLADLSLQEPIQGQLAAGVALPGAEPVQRLVPLVIAMTFRAIEAGAAHRGVSGTAGRAMALLAELNSAHAQTFPFCFPDAISNQGFRIFQSGRRGIVGIR